MIIPPGKVDIRMLQPSGNYKAAFRSAEVSERRRVNLSIALEPVKKEVPVPVPVAARKLRGEGSVPYAIQASGDVRVVDNMTIDVQIKRFQGL